MSKLATQHRTLSFTRADTIGGMLLERSEGPQGDDIRFVFMKPEEACPGFSPQGEDDRITFTYSETYEMAARAATCLRRRGVGPGDRVLLMLSTGPSFLAAYYGCQLLGSLPVPIFPPTSLNRIEDHLNRIARIARICAARAVVVNSQLVPVLSLVRGRDHEARKALENVVRDIELMTEESGPVAPAPARADDPAMLQFTSGSTGDPKGVVLTHRNVIENIRAIGQAAEFRDGDVAMAWLPLFHDMGLIGHVLTSAMWRVALVLMPPEVFIRRPGEWLRAMSRYRVAQSTAPNFAYNLCVRKIKDRELDGVDLSSWRIAYCGAEPVDPATVLQFSERFQPYGFDSRAFFPVYGMAEFTLAATFPRPGDEVRFDRVDRERFESMRVAVPCENEAGGADVAVWVSVGLALPGHQVRVVGPDRTPLPERHEGEIELAGPSMMSAYYKDLRATAEIIRDGWLSTGDLGYIAGGELFVTGRRKDLIIKGGKNLYPQDIESAAASVEGVRIGCCVAIGVANESRGTEDLVVICETRVTDDAELDRLRTDIRASVYKAIGTAPDAVKLVRPGTVAKTSSGKLQRRHMRHRYLQGQLQPDTPSKLTLVRLKMSQILERFRR
ncbi:MAG: fatty acyl-AMP ligase [Proteobacteria bacterium]|nr:fatty acyl-AMP ligase [Pseudomonadota bacterium]